MKPIITRKTDNWCSPVEEIKNYVDTVGGTILGVFGFDDNKERFIYDLWENERNSYGYIKLKENEVIVRYLTYTTVVGGIAPLIKINLKNGLVYHVKDYESEEVEVEFETRGKKVTYLRTIL